MNQILIKQELNTNISKEEFLDDITCLIDVLRDCYGMYEYFGDDLFLQAKENVKNYLKVYPTKVLYIEAHMNLNL